MKSTVDCLPCFVEHSLHVAKMVTDDTEKQADIVKKTLREVSGMDMNITPPQMARTIHGIIRELTGMKDPYLDVKDKSTEFALELMPMLRKDIEKSEDQFETIIRLVIAGNIIDFGADRHFNLDTAHHRIMEVLDMPLDHKNVEHLKKAMDKAENILYIADNCGEAVLDRLLIELYSEKITLAVRGNPILNDITMREVPMSNLEGLPKKIIDTGDATPGVVLEFSSDEFNEAFNSADLIVAKGQGNYESISGTDRPIFYLLRAKCPVICDHLDADLGSLQIISKNITF